MQRAQRGAVLLIMLAILGLGSTWFLVSSLNAESGGIEAQRKKHNAQVLQRAKQMVIGHAALQAAKADETNPGRLACPEPAGSAGGTTEGSTAGNCSLPAIGRYPWQTFGSEKLLDAHGEPLWYVVSAGWALSSGTTPPLTTVINSSSLGNLIVNARPVSSLTQSFGTANAVSVNHGFRTGDVVKIAGATPANYSVSAPVTVVDANTFTFRVDATLPAAATGANIRAGDAVVALVIAPGPAINAAASAGCTVQNQVRSVPGPSIDALNYLECYDAANGVFSTSAPAASSNDQVMTITAAEILPGVEAAVAARMARDVAPALRDVYLGAGWGLGGRERMFPFAATFADPDLGTTDFHGTPMNTQGLLPFNFGEACNPVTEARCLPMTFSPATPPVAYRNGGFGFIRTGTQTCFWDPADATAAVCQGEYQEDAGNPSGVGMYIEMTATINNVGRGLRVLEARVEARDDVLLGPWQVRTPTIATTMDLDLLGSATIRFGANLPNIDTMGWGTYANYRIRLKVADHRILSTRPRQISFNTGNTSEIRVGHTVVGATSGATGRVSGVTVASGNWESGLGAAGTLSFYSVTGAFANNEDLRVLGVTRARSASTDSDTDAQLSWFARNAWFRHAYYAVAANYSWTGSGTCSDTPTVTCLQVAYLPIAADQTKQRALLVLMGQRVGAQVRPSGGLTNYLDSAANSDLNAAFEQLAVGRASNDRFITISKNP